MKRSIISSRLVRFTLRGNWLPFLIVALVSGLVGALVGSTYFGYGSSIEILNIAIVCPALAALPLALIPLTVRAFGFYMKRCESDFFESLPYTRTQVLLSMTAALSILTVGMFLLSAVVSSLTLLDALVGNIFLVGESLLLLLAYLIASLIAIFVTTTAVSVTGHSFNAMLAAALIIFAPKSVVTQIASVAERSPLTDGMSELLKDQYNLLTAMPMGVPRLSAYIFSLVLVVFFCAISIILFKRRRSEITTSFYASPLVGHILRIAVTLTPSFILADQILGYDSDNGFEIILSSFISLVVLLVVYFGYELIAVRGKRAVANAARGLPMLVAVNVIVLAIGFSVGAVMDSRTPVADQIKSVSISSGSYESYYYDSNEYSMSDYVNLKMSDIKLEDKEAREIIARALAENSEAYRSDKYDMTYYASETTYYEIVAEITTSLGSFKRRLMIPYEDRARLSELLSLREEYIDAWMDIPREPYAVMYRNSDGSGISIDRSDAELIYEAMLRDLDKISFDEWVLANDAYGTGTLVVVVWQGGEAFKLHIPVSEHTPEAYALTCEIRAARAKEIYADITERIESAVAGGDSIDINLEIVLDSDGYYTWLTVDSSETGKKVAEFFLDCVTSEITDISIDGSYVHVGIMGPDRYESYRFDYSDKYTAEELKTILGELYPENYQ